MKLTPEQKKEFALAQIAPYFKDPSLCGYNEKSGSCSYLTEDGKMCVAGKNMINPTNAAVIGGSILYQIERSSQAEIFKSEVVGKLRDAEWNNLQGIHDAIAYKADEELFKGKIEKLGLFTYEELVNYANKLN